MKWMAWKLWLQWPSLTAQVVKVVMRLDTCYVQIRRWIENTAS